MKLNPASLTSVHRLGLTTCCSLRQSPGMGSYRPISRIAIIGGGPAGITSAKYLLAENAFDKIDIFEQRDRVGGVWNLSSTDRSRRIPIPQTDSRYGSSHKPRSSDDKGNDKSTKRDTNNDSLEFESPLYEYLETNIPKQLMRYSDTPFPEHYPLFPSHQEVLQYLEDYADEVRQLIRFETQVQDVSLDQEALLSGRKEWQVTIKNLRSGHCDILVYDAIVIANGHYTVPHVVNISGLQQWNEAYPGTVIHSKAYRRPEVFRNQTVLVIGNSASGLDIAAQIGQYSNRLYLSSRSESIFGQKKVEWRTDVDEVIEFLPPTKHHRAVRTRSGRVVDGLQSVIFATGYFFSFPFLSNLIPAITTDGLRTRGVYKDFLHIEHPELFFPVLNMKVIPFGLAENEAAVIARIWSGRLPTPTKEEMYAWEREKLKEKGDGKYFHVKKFPEDAAQMNELYRWAKSARPSTQLENSGYGKLGWPWDERMVWMRTKFADVKAAYAQRGDGKRQVRTMEELGFHFEQWRQTATEEDLEMFRQAMCLSIGE